MMTLVCCASAYLLVLAVKVGFAWIYVRRFPAVREREGFADVTILQPILGGDPALADALTCNLETLPGARFVWLLDEDDAVGRAVCGALARRHANARIQIVVTPRVPQATNPKLFKLARGQAQVETPFVVVLDDDTRLSRLGLSALIDALTEYDVGTALPLYQRGSTPPSRLVEQFVNTQSILTYLPLLVVAPALTLNGMCYALRTDRLRELGGFAPLVHRLTDDLAVARLIREAGGRIRQLIHPLAITTTVPDWRRYVRVMHRWFVFARLQVQAQNLSWKVIIFTMHGVPPLLLWIVVVMTVHTSIDRSGWFPWIILGALFIVRVCLIRFAQRLITRCVAHQPLSSLLSELLQPLHLVHALVSRRIYWRSRVIDVRADDDFSFQ